MTIKQFNQLVSHLCMGVSFPLFLYSFILWLSHSNMWILSLGVSGVMFSLSNQLRKQED